MDLIVAKSSKDVHSVLNNEYYWVNKEKSAGLALWPDAQFAFEDMGIRHITPNDLMGPVEHELLATEITTLSKTWWQKLFPDIEEPNIDGLKISTIYEYEIEVAFSYVLFNIYAARKAVETLRPKTCIFTVSQDNDNSWFSEEIMITPSSLMTRLSNYPWERILIDKLHRHNKVQVIFVDSNGDTHNSRSMNVRSRLSVFFKRSLVDWRYFSSVIKRKLQINNEQLKGNEGIVISGRGRCLGSLIKLLGRSHDISYFSNKIFGEKVLNDNQGCHASYQALAELNGYEFVNDRKDKFVICDISYIEIVKAMASFVMRQFPYLNGHYEYIQKQISHSGRPRAYITINAASSINRLEIWAFHKSGVRTIWHGDGLGQPNQKIWKVVKSAFWPESPAEKWLVSENARHFFLENGYNEKGLRVTGYLDNNFQGKPKTLSNVTQRLLRKMIGIPAGSKVVMYASSICRKLIMRLISEEIYFEVFQAIKDVGEAFASNQNIFTIIKLHPGISKKYSELIKKAVSHVGNIKIIEHIPIHFLIDISDAVIVYHSSVGLEALYRGKHLVVYNKTGRPSYLTEIIPGLNKDPSKGPAVRLVRDKENLYLTVMHLINTRLEQNESGKEVNSGLSYCLANADPKFKHSILDMKGT